MRAFVVWLLLTGCGGLSLRPVNPDHAARKQEVTARLGIDETNLNQMLKAEQAECDSLDNKVFGWTVGSAVLGVLGGGSGLTALFTDSTPRYVVGGLGIGLTALTTAATMTVTHYSSLYSHKCTVNTGGR